LLQVAHRKRPSKVCESRLATPAGPPATACSFVSVWHTTS
jgi:hypothetical protein